MIKTINNEEKVECCILVADVIINELKLSYSYSIPIDKIEDYEWAFNHDEIIKETFNMFVNIPWYKKFIINKYTNWIIKPLMQKLYLTPSGAMY